MRRSEAEKFDALQRLRRGQGVALVARTLAISPSTVRRWRSEAEQAESDAHLIAHFSDAEQRREIAEFAKRLGRLDEFSVKQLIAGYIRHGRLTGRYNRLRFGVLGVINVVTMLVYILLILQLSETRAPLRAYVSGLLLLALIYALIVAFFLWLLNSLASLWGTFFVSSIALLSAEQLLEDEGGGDRLNFPRTWQLGARRDKRRLKVNLRRAERSLSRRTVVSRSLRTVGAREWELTHRRYVASTIAYVEVILETRGGAAHEESRRLLRQVVYLNLMRDWSYRELPRLENVTPWYRNRMQRLVASFVVIIPLAGAIIASVVDFPELVGVLRNYQR